MANASFKDGTLHSGQSASKLHHIYWFQNRSYSVLDLSCACLFESKIVHVQLPWEILGFYFLHLYSYVHAPSWNQVNAFCLYKLWLVLHCHSCQLSDIYIWSVGKWRKSSMIPIRISFQQYHFCFHAIVIKCLVIRMVVIKMFWKTSVFYVLSFVSHMLQVIKVFIIFYSLVISAS